MNTPQKIDIGCHNTDRPTDLSALQKELRADDWTSYTDSESYASCREWGCGVRNTLGRVFSKSWPRSHSREDMQDCDHFKPFFHKSPRNADMVRYAAAVESDNIALVTKLVAEGADVNDVYYGSTALNLAIDVGSVTMLKHLISLGAKVDTYLAAKELRSCTPSNHDTPIWP